MIAAFVGRHCKEKSTKEVIEIDQHYSTIEEMLSNNENLAVHVRPRVLLDFEPRDERINAITNSAVTNRVQRTVECDHTYEFIDDYDHISVANPDDSHHTDQENCEDTDKAISIHEDKKDGEEDKTEPIMNENDVSMHCAEEFKRDSIPNVASEEVDMVRNEAYSSGSGTQRADEEVVTVLNEAYGRSPNLSAIDQSPYENVGVAEEVHRNDPQSMVEYENMKERHHPMAPAKRLLYENIRASMTDTIGDKLIETVIIKRKGEVVRQFIFFFLTQLGCNF